MLNVVILNVVMLNVIILNVVMLNIKMLNVVLLKIVAPKMFVITKHTSLLFLDIIITLEGFISFGQAQNYKLGLLIGGRGNESEAINGYWMVSKLLRASKYQNVLDPDY